jgi:hypothetical protein
MLAFIDESGSIHQNDSNPVSALVAVCMAERAHRGVSRQLYATKRAVLGRDDAGELKAIDLINERTFRRIPEKRELVESVFDLINRLDITIFAIVVPRPTKSINFPVDHLPTPHQFLLQRINALAEEVKQEAILVYDGNGMNIQGMNLSACVSDYIFKVAEYNNILRRLVDTPLFVDSRVTPGIQLADLIASVVRQCDPINHAEGITKSSSYSSAINRYYRIIKAKSRDDLRSDSGHTLYGIYKIREDQLYQRDENIEIEQKNVAEDDK